MVIVDLLGDPVRDPADQSVITSRQSPGNQISLLTNRECLAEPRRRYAGLAAFFPDVGNRLGVIVDLLADTVELREGFLSIEADLIALKGIVLGGKVRRQT